MKALLLIPAPSCSCVMFHESHEETFRDHKVQNECTPQISCLPFPLMFFLPVLQFLISVFRGSFPCDDCDFPYLFVRFIFTLQPFDVNCHHIYILMVF